MKITQFSEYGQCDKVIDIVESADLVPPSGKSVTIRMLAMSINPSDILTIDGEYGVRPALPFTPGGEGVGQVEAVGEDVEKLYGMLTPLIADGTLSGAIEARNPLNEIKAAVTHAAKGMRSGKIILTAPNNDAAQKQES